MHPHRIVLCIIYSFFLYVLCISSTDYYFSERCLATVCVAGSVGARRRPRQGSAAGLITADFICTQLVCLATGLLAQLIIYSSYCVMLIYTWTHTLGHTRTHTDTQGPWQTALDSVLTIFRTHTHTQTHTLIHSYTHSVWLIPSTSVGGRWVFLWSDQLFPPDCIRTNTQTHTPTHIAGVCYRR